jgi:hypothetical protein
LRENSLGWSPNDPFSTPLPAPGKTVKKDLGKEVGNDVLIKITKRNST